MRSLRMFQDYMGTGLVVGWYLISLIYLFLREKKKQARILFLYVPVLLLLLFFNPLFARLISHMEEVYWRILWLLPVTITIAYAAANLYGKAKGRMKIVLAAVFAALTALSGSFIYRTEGLVKAENSFHVPQAVVDICDAIVVEGREVRALFPDEMLYYVRQYTARVCMPYGREVLEYPIYDELHELMGKETIDASDLSRLAKKAQCHYVILPKERKLEGSLLDYDYLLFDTIDGYSVFKDTTMDFSVVPWEN